MFNITPFFFVLIFTCFYISRCIEEENVLNFDNASKNESNCGKSGYILVATVDGNLTALDFDTGSKCWTLSLDKEAFFSSSLYELEVFENGTRVFLIPSLDGVLFKYDKVKLEPLPLNAESFLSQSATLDQSTFVTGGKFKLVYGIHRHTGEICYKCSVNGCERFKEVSSESALIVELLIQTVSAVDSVSAEQKWHFKVAEVQIKLISDSVSNRNSSHDKSNTDFDDSAVLPINNSNNFNILKTVKISLQNGYTARINHSSFEFTWMYKTGNPIIDVWFVKEKSVHMLDPFSDETEFFSIDFGDGKHTALLFLGSYMDQFFVKQSKKLKNEVINSHALSRQVLYQAHCLPSSFKPDEHVILASNESSALMPLNLNINDHGFYFYINFSVYDNATHCVLNFSYPKQYRKLVGANYWLGIIPVAIVAYILTVWTVLRQLQVKKEFANESTSTIELVTAAPEFDDESAHKKPEFVSRFHKDFEFITTLGKGGFGVVMEVRNKIDDCEYAVKRIRIRGGEKYKKDGYGSVMREVKALAKLDHPGIVRYFNSWVENPPKGWQELKDKEMDISDVTYSTNCGDDDDDEADDADDELKSSSDSELMKKLSLVDISKELRKNPLNPFEEKFCDIGETGFDEKKSVFPHGELLSWSNETYGSNEESDTLSLHTVCERSTSNSRSSNDSRENSTSSGELFQFVKLSSKTYVKNTLEKEINETEDVVFLKSSSEDEIGKTRVKFQKASTFDYESSENEGALFVISPPKSELGREEASFLKPPASENAVFLHLMKINASFVITMKNNFLVKLRPYLFNDNLNDLTNSKQEQPGWVGWTYILNKSKTKNMKHCLLSFQVWLISVICSILSAEGYYYNLLCFNLSNIIWDVNLLLEDDVCECESSALSPEVRIRNFLHLRNTNLELTVAMKSIYLIKLRHYLFCEPKNCSKPSWESIFYRSDIQLYRKNLNLFQNWIHSILDQCDKYPEILVSNLHYFLSEVKDILANCSTQPVSSEMFYSTYENVFNQPTDSIPSDSLIMFYKPSQLPKNSSSQNIEKTEETTSDKPGFLYIQMQLCRRESLRNWLDLHSLNRSYSEVMNIFCQIVDAMDYVHTRGLMHRDLKPSNIYFSLEGVIKIGDFGLATQFEVQVPCDISALSHSMNSHTREIGTELYISPEQRSKKRYNFKTDIFPLGIILYELLVPFKTQSERYQAINLARDCDFIENFVTKYPNECMLVTCLLAHEPEDRPTAQEIKNHPVCQSYLQMSRA